MKQRDGFVSNSSSSSFVIIGDPPAEFACHFAEVPAAGVENVLQRIKAENPEGKKVFLSLYFSDCCESDIGLRDACDLYLYDSGNHGGPYSEDKFEKLAGDRWDGVWIRKEDLK